MNKQRSADIYHHKFEKWYRNAVPPSKHYYRSHATFPFTREAGVGQLLAA
jgi:hypothetical protein